MDERVAKMTLKNEINETLDNGANLRTTTFHFAFEE
jgi:hypothetical protein